MTGLDPELCGIIQLCARGQNDWRNHAEHLSSMTSENTPGQKPAQSSEELPEWARWRLSHMGVWTRLSKEIEKPREVSPDHWELPWWDVDACTMDQNLEIEWEELYNAGVRPTPE